MTPDGDPLVRAGGFRMHRGEGSTGPIPPQTHGEAEGLMA